MKMTFKYRLYPTREQKQRIQFTLERCRLLYNRLLAERIDAYKSQDKSLSYVDQANTLPERKMHIPHLKQVHSQVLQDVVRRLDKAYQSFYGRVRRGEKPGFPRYKPKQRYHSFTFPQAGYSVQGAKLKLSMIGHVKLKLHRPLEGVMKTCTITMKNGEYYACFACEVEVKPLPLTTTRVGMDLGLTHLAITSDGELIEAPKTLRKNELKLKRKQKAVSRKQKGSNRRRKLVQHLARMHEKVANQRRDHAHKISRKLVDRYGFLAFEDLNIKGLIKNHHVARSIADAGWGQLVQFIMYKAERAGRIVVQVDPRNTSRDCSMCDEPVPKKLSERTHRCPHCGYEANRDVNAARNILKRALAS